MKPILIEHILLSAVIIPLSVSFRMPSIARIPVARIINTAKLFSMQQDHVLREHIYENRTDEGSALLISDVTSFGINTALAEEHIM